jgi:hypothetical protein
MAADDAMLAASEALAPEEPLLDELLIGFAAL